MAFRARILVFSSLAWLAACAPAAFHPLPTTEELNRLQPRELYEQYPQLGTCAEGQSVSAFATRSAKSLVEAWGEPDEWSISAWNLLFWYIPLAPVTEWRWTRFEREIEITVWHPLARGYRASAWECYFGPLRIR